MSTISPLNHVVFLLAHGFDETVTVRLATQLRQARLPVLYVGLSAELVTGQWATTLRPDVAFADLDSEQPAPLVVLCGPSENIERLFAHTDVRVWVRMVLEGNYVATATAQPALPGITFPDWGEHYLPQGKLGVRQYGRLLIDHVWSKLGVWGVVQAEQRALRYLSDDALKTIAAEQMLAADQAQLSTLMEKNSQGQLTAQEQEALTILTERGDRLMLRKAEAAALLAQRGRPEPIDISTTDA